MYLTEKYKHFITWTILSDWKQTLLMPGLYSIYVRNKETGKMKLIYIGISDNVFRRLERHPIIMALYALINKGDEVVIKVKFKQYGSERKENEKNLINRLRPKANTKDYKDWTYRIKRDKKYIQVYEWE